MKRLAAILGAALALVACDADNEPAWSSPNASGDIDNSATSNQNEHPVDETVEGPTP